MSCPNPVTGVNVNDCAAINYAANTPPSELYDLTYTGVTQTVPASPTDMPVAVQTALNGCALPGCKAVSYDFSGVSNTPVQLASVPFINSTKMTSQTDAAVILKSDVTPQPPVISGLPGYDFFSTPFELRNLTNGGYIHVKYPGVPATGNSLYDCAEKCNQGSDCAGFNFRSSVGTCTFLPTGASTSSSTQATPYASDEWVKRFDSSNKGMAYRKKPVIRVNVNDTIPAYADLSSTGRFCRDSSVCNTVISNTLTIGTLTQFGTSDFEACYGCPTKQYRTSGSTVHTVTNEMGLAKTFGTQQEAKTALMYNGGSAASHAIADFLTGRIVTIKKLDGTTLFSNFNSNVNGTGTVSTGWVNAKNTARKIFYDPVDYIVNGYIIMDARSFEHYVPGNGTWTKELDPKYSPGYTSNVVVIT
jgi:hypothetical protein